MFVILGIISSIIAYSYHISFSLINLHVLAGAIYNRLYFDSLTSMLYYSYLDVSSFAANRIDLGIIEHMTAHGINSAIVKQ